MTSELNPVCEFLERHAPFNTLSRPELERLAAQLEIEYFRREAWVLTEGDACDRLYIVRSGALREWDADGQLSNEYGEGDAAGAPQLTAVRPSQGGESPARATRLRAIADTLVYTLTEARFAQLCRDNPGVALFFTARAAERLRAVTQPPPNSEVAGSIWAQPVRSLLTRSALSLAGDVSIREAALLMTQEHVSSVFIAGGERLGIVTDHDLRSRVIGAGRSIHDPVRSVMSSPVVSVDAGCSLLDAMMEMLNRGMHHLAVRESDVIIGALASTDLLQALGANPVVVVRDIRRQQSTHGLQLLARQRANVVQQLVASGARARDIHRVLTRIGDAITRRLIELAWQELRAKDAEPLNDYAWVAFGSQARDEHTLGSDQDNGLILADSVDANDWRLRELAERVCEGLDACGYPRCRGEIMAVTQRWCQPITVWRDYFTRWVNEPSRDAVLRGSIFFDMRSIYGNAALVDELLDHIAQQVEAKPLFVAHLAREALVRRPPLGLFGRFVLEHSGDHAPSLDLKQRGLVPVVDLARVYALEAGCRSANTLERLHCAADKGTLSPTGSTELLDAFELIARLRLQHHARRLAAGLPVEHQLDPRELSSNERKHLRDAFSVVKTMQDALQHSHQLGNLSV